MFYGFQHTNLSHILLNFSLAHDFSAILSVSGFLYLRPKQNSEIPWIFTLLPVPFMLCSDLCFPHPSYLRKGYDFYSSKPHSKGQAPRNLCQFMCMNSQHVQTLFSKLVLICSSIPWFSYLSTGTFYMTPLPSTESFLPFAKSAFQDTRNLTLGHRYLPL